MNRKFEIEKVLHELIRDLPDAMKAEKYYNRGLITADETLRWIANAYRIDYDSKKQ